MSIPSNRCTIIQLIVVILILIFATNFIYRGFNPVDRNKIVLMFEDPADFRLVKTMEFDGKVRWQQAISMSGAIGPRKKTTVHVVDVRRAWFDGTVTLKDIDGDTIASVPISPHGRYGGTLVILVDANGKSFSAWNQVPDVNS